MADSASPLTDRPAPSPDGKCPGRPPSIIVDALVDYDPMGVRGREERDAGGSPPIPDEAQVSAVLFWGGVFRKAESTLRPASPWRPFPGRCTRSRDPNSPGAMNRRYPKSR